MIKAKTYYVDSASTVDDGIADGGEVHFSLEEAADSAEEFVREYETAYTVYELVPVMVVETGKPVRRMITK